MLTMVEIARLSGVSRATVSAVLNGKPGVAEKSRAKVLAVLREHDNASRRMTHALMGNLSRVIMTVVRDINNPYFTMFIDGVTRVMKGRGFHMLYHSTQESRDDEVEALAAFRDRQLAGLIIFPVEAELPHDHIRELVEERHPVVTIGAVPGLDTHWIDVDHRASARLAAQHLLDAGHRRVTCLAGPVDSPPTKDRVLGFMEAILDQKRDFEDSMVVRAGYSSQEGYEAALKILRGASRPTGVVCFNDLVAVGVYRAAHELGLRIPQDLAIVGCDDIDLAAVMGPPLTTVATFPREMGEAAAEILLQRIEGELSPSDSVNRLIEPRVVKRGSVCPPADLP